MNYDSATDYLYNLTRFGIKLGLENTLDLLGRLGNPHEKLKYIHVAGSNGKGTVCAIIASILQAQGYKVGLFTSPHLINFTERIRISGKEIERDDFLKLMSRIRPVINAMASEDKTKQPTFFEVTTAMAFMHFAENEVDFAVLEVGLGGRLDSTNVVNPLVTVITRIALEHTEHLGKKLDRIAWEKAGILKENVPVVTSEVKHLKVIKRVAKERNAEVLTVGDDIEYERGGSSLKCQNFTVKGKNTYKLKTRLLGKFQIENAAAAIGAIEVLRERGVKIKSSAIRKGMLEAKWPGRFEVVRNRPLVILDCAHNPDGAKALAESLKDLGISNPTLVIGLLSDKDLPGIARQLGRLTKELVITVPDTPRACDPKDVRNAFKPYIKDIRIISEVENAVKDTVSSNAGNKADRAVCITGSIYTVGEAMSALKNMQVEKIEQVMKRLRKEYSLGAFPGKDVESTTIKKEEREPFRVLMATILSHRTRDENTHLATERLFKRFDTPRRIAKANVKEIEKLIRPAGFYCVKAKRLKEVSGILLKKFDGKVPSDFDELLSLPSVGRKTANCVLVYGFGIPAVPVDVHVEVIAKRLGLVEEDADVLEVEKQLQSVVPNKYWLHLNELFVRFGKEICTTRSPKCTECFLSDLCNYFSEYVQK
jgi:dihydrofolate synthase/folylpolyglutamate synthase